MLLLYAIFCGVASAQASLVTYGGMPSSPGSISFTVSIAVGDVVACMCGEASGSAVPFSLFQTSSAGAEVWYSLWHSEDTTLSVTAQYVVVSALSSGSFSWTCKQMTPGSVLACSYAVVRGSNRAFIAGAGQSTGAGQTSCTVTPG
jgi:hypothetical protein